MATIGPSARGAKGLDLARAFLLGATLVGIMAEPTPAQTWVEDAFEDFADGTLDAAGNNIYVSRDGKIRTIHRFDLNQDGYIDLLFCQTHDSFSIIPATLAEVTRGREVRPSSLAVEGSLQTATADLNRDGHADLVFCPNSGGLQNPRRFVTVIYGGADGWPSWRSTSALPVNEVKAVATADLNRDGWEDIVALNSEAWVPKQPAGNIVRIFWGGDKGFLNTRYHDEGVAGGLGLAAADFDQNGAGDIAVLSKEGSVTIFWAVESSGETYRAETTQVTLPAGEVLSIAAGDGNHDGRQDLLVGTARGVLHLVCGMPGRGWRPPESLELYPASHIVMGDLDGDGHGDLSLSYFAQQYAMGGELQGAVKGSGEAVHILWGDAAGFSRNRSTDLEVNHLSASALGDFDGDGRVDVAVAINRGETQFQTESLFFFGKGCRRFAQGSQGATTIGATHVLAVPTHGGSAQAVFCNGTGGTIGENVPLLLYWGGAGGFCEKRRTEIPFRSGYEATCADFNADGYPDLAVMNQMHGGQTLNEDPWAGANLFWGTAAGWDLAAGTRQVLREPYLGSSNTADLNKDGYLDLVLGQFDYGDDPTHLILYYGGPEGFSPQRRTSILCPGRSLSIQLADYDRNGWLDIAAGSHKEGARVFYGDPSGFDPNRRVDLNAPAVGDLETADLNGDGWLDILVCSFRDMTTNNHHDMGLFIYWGGRQGFHPGNVQWLPAMTPLGPVIADFDHDGYLDIFAPSYHAELTREQLPCYLYWGSARGFQSRDRAALINDSGADGLAADFNRDGLLDLAVVSHTVDGDHRGLSTVFYNDGQRFAHPRVERLPTRGPHWSWNEDMGHIYDRRWRQTYESSVYRWEGDRLQARLTRIAEIPEGTQLQFEVAAAEHEVQISPASWRPVDATERFALRPADRCLKYRAIFISDNGDRFPVLDQVTIAF